VPSDGLNGRLPAPFTAPVGTAAFVDFLSAAAPDLLPGRRALPPGSAADLAAHGTTIIALTYADGVLMAGDRRATMGNQPIHSPYSHRGCSEIVPSQSAEETMNRILPT